MVMKARSGRLFGHIGVVQMGRTLSFVVVIGVFAEGLIGCGGDGGAASPSFCSTTPRGRSSGSMVPATCIRSKPSSKKERRIERKELMACGRLCYLC